MYGGPWRNAKGYTDLPPADTMRNNDTRTLLWSLVTYVTHLFLEQSILVFHPSGLNMSYQHWKEVTYQLSKAVLWFLDFKTTHLERHNWCIPVHQVHLVLSFSIWSCAEKKKICCLVTSYSLPETIILLHHNLCRFLL